MSLDVRESRPLPCRVHNLWIVQDLVMSSVVLAATVIVLDLFSEEKKRPRPSGVPKLPNVGEIS